MMDDTIFSRRLAFSRIGAIALAAFAVPAVLTVSKAYADDKGDSGSGDSGSDDSDSDDSDSDDSSDSSSSDDDSNDDEGAVSPPAAKSGSPLISLFKKKKKK